MRRLHPEHALLLLAVLLFILMIVLAQGCGPAARPCPAPAVQPPIRVVTVRVACLATAPPEVPAGFAVHACDGFAGCLSEASLRSLVVYLAALQRFAREAWLACGPTSVQGGTLSPGGKP